MMSAVSYRSILLFDVRFISGLQRASYEIVAVIWPVVLSQELNTEDIPLVTMEHYEEVGFCCFLQILP